MPLTLEDLKRLEKQGVGGKTTIDEQKALIGLARIGLSQLSEPETGQTTLQDVIDELTEMFREGEDVSVTLALLMKVKAEVEELCVAVRVTDYWTGDETLEHVARVERVIE